jgi:hypothetical protein
MDTVTTDEGRAAAGGPGVVALGGKPVAVAQPTPADFYALQSELNRQERAARKSPLAILTDDPAFAKLPPACQAEAVRTAVARQVDRAAGPPEPDRAVDELTDRLKTHDGATWWAWWLAKKIDPTLTLSAVRAAVPDGWAALQLLDELLDATGLGAVEKKSAGASG